MLFKVSNLNSNLAVTLGYLVPASNNSALENKILTQPQPKKAKLLYCIRKSKLFFLMLNWSSIYLKAHFYISSLWNTWKIGFSQSHSLKRLSGSVASGRPNCSLLNAGHALSSMTQTISESAFLISSLRDTSRIKFSQSHSLKRQSCSVASGRPNCSLLNACHALSSMFPLELVLFIKLKAGHHHLFSTTLKCIQGRS